MFQHQQTQVVFFQISSSIDNVKHIFVYLKNSYRDANDHRQAEMSPYTMNTFSLHGGASLNNCRLGIWKWNFLS